MYVIISEIMFEVDSDEYDSDDFYDDGFGSKKCCAVELRDDFDPTKPPTTGEEYLQHVMYEALHCDAISTDAVLKQKSNEQAALYKQTSYNIPESSLLLPSKEWNEQKLSEFIKFRKFIQSKLPSLHLRLAGDINVTRKIDVEYPKFSVASRLSGKTLDYITAVLADRVDNLTNGATIPNTISVWIFMVLALLQESLLGSVIGNLRVIARKCSELRAQLPADAPSEMYNNLNFFICIIGLYFKQADVIN